jgi:hypothetical protein
MNAFSLPRLQPGVAASLAAALLFGAAAPLAKLLLAQVTPGCWPRCCTWDRASGWPAAPLRRAPPVRLPRGEWRWLAGAVFAGGGSAGVADGGLAGMPASQASLLLNGEAVLTALLAGSCSLRTWTGGSRWAWLAIVAGGVLLGLAAGRRRRGGPWRAGAAGAGRLPRLGLSTTTSTRKVSLADAVVARDGEGAASPGHQSRAGARAWRALAGAAGWWARRRCWDSQLRVSLVLFVLGLRALGNARTGAYFSVAPSSARCWPCSCWASRSPAAGAAALLMALGVWLHLTERHEHRHAHLPMDHAHDTSTGRATSTTTMRTCRRCRPARAIRTRTTTSPWCIRIRTIRMRTTPRALARLDLRRQHDAALLQHRAQGGRDGR